MEASRCKIFVLNTIVYCFAMSVAMSGFAGSYVTKNPSVMNETSLPEGSYLKSCDECTVVDSMLFCSCERTSGVWISSKLLVPCQDDAELTNNNGSLKCAKPDSSSNSDSSKASPSSKSSWMELLKIFGMAPTASK